LDALINVKSHGKPTIRKHGQAFPSSALSVQVQWVIRSPERNSQRLSGNIKAASECSPDQTKLDRLPIRVKGEASDESAIESMLEQFHHVACFFH
jgi:hypothetical protein